MNIYVVMESDGNYNTHCYLATTDKETAEAMLKLVPWADIIIHEITDRDEELIKKSKIWKEN